MRFNYISTYNFFSPLRFSVTTNESALSRATTEATTGRFADVGLELGHGISTDVSLRADFSFADQIVDTNGLASGRLDVTQDRITQLTSTAQAFLKNLITVRNTGAIGAQSILPTAAGDLQDLIGSLNVSYNGSFVFAGLNTQIAPVKKYAPGSASKTAADLAFTTFFGFSQTSPLVSGITAAQMTTFLNTSFDGEFVSTTPPAPPGPWNTNWSSATDQVLTSRISTTEIADTSVSANDPSFRKLAEAYTALSDLGTTSLTQGAFDAILDKATDLVTSALNGLTTLGSNVGAIQQRISGSSDKLLRQKDILNLQILNIEKVEPAEAAARVTALQNQIQTSLSLTARLQNLSLVNYL